jgi:Ni2+-binding GTPase involved in maturation of urease and hydrogenase
MNSEHTTRFAMIGGFLGAGKTTLLSQIARRYVEAGKRVAIITNDQAADLVDTRHLQGLGFDVGEVSGACFCCSFDELISTADRLSSAQRPDLILAEPVGSCTDLVATIVLPMQQMWGDQFDIAPFGVLLKPSHGARILDPTATKRSGFSPQAEYIFRKQIEEADYVMIGRADTMDEATHRNLADHIRSLTPARVIAVSPKTGQGVDDVIGMIQSPSVAGARLLDIDYDVYADGEAELGWVNLSAIAESQYATSLDQLAQEIVRRIAAGIIAQIDGGEIAHLKASVRAGDCQAVANVVDNDGNVDCGLEAGRSVSGKFEIIVNARVSMDPALLESLCGDGVRQSCLGASMNVDSVRSHSLRPGRPMPTHRITAR